MKYMEEGRDQKRHGSNGDAKDLNGHDRAPMHSRKSTRRHLNQDHFFHRDFMLAPSAFANEVDPDTAPDELADIYTGKLSFLQLQHIACLRPSVHWTSLGLCTLYLPNTAWAIGHKSLRNVTYLQ